MARKGLLSKLNSLMEPAPTSADPEDYDGWDGTSAVNATHANNSDDDSMPQNYAPSKLRADADMNSGDWGKKYSAKKVTRKSLQELSEDEDDESLEEDLSEVDAEEDDELDDDELDDDEELDEDEEDGDEDEFDDDEEIDYKASKKSSKKSKPSTQHSAFVGVDDELDMLDQEDQETKAAKGNGPLVSQQERATKAKALLADYDTVLEMRIALQQVVAVVNQRTQNAEPGDGVINENNSVASSRLQQVIQKLCSLREDLRCNHQIGEARSTHVIDNVKSVKSNKEEDDENSDDEEEEEEPPIEQLKHDVLLGEGVSLKRKSNELDDDEEDEEDEDRESKLSQVWGAIDDGFKRGQPFWENTLELWQRRAQIGGVAVSKHKFKVVNRNVFAQSAAALEDRPRALKRAHPLKKVKNDLEGQDQNKEDVNVEAESDHGASKLDTSIFDDSTFYHSLLKDFLENRSSSIEQAQAVLAAAAKRRRTKRHGVDTRATKGRKIRYEPLPKLENFMFPSNAYAPPLNVDELFSSLFGTRTA